MDKLHTEVQETLSDLCTLYNQAEVALTNYYTLKAHLGHELQGLKAAKNQVMHTVRDYMLSINTRQHELQEAFMTVQGNLEVVENRITALTYDVKIIDLANLKKDIHRLTQIIEKVADTYIGTATKVEEMYANLSTLKKKVDTLDNTQDNSGNDRLRSLNVYFVDQLNTVRSRIDILSSEQTSIDGTLKKLVPSINTMQETTARHAHSIIQSHTYLDELKRSLQTLKHSHENLIKYSKIGTIGFSVLITILIWKIYMLETKTTQLT